MNPLFGTPGAPELLLIFAVVVLLFGAKKLPELARGSGRALRIFKSETKGLVDGDDKLKTEEPLEIEARDTSAEMENDRIVEIDGDRIAHEPRDGS
ncbi:MAG: Sec-independent protein translocase subunit TatA [Nocardioides sp.]